MITVKVNAPTGTIVLDRRENSNALSRSMVSELSQAFGDLRLEKKVRGIVLTGAGAHFCSGVDLTELHESYHDPAAIEQWHADAQALCGLIEQILMFPKPVVAAVDGAAMGSGLALMLACDLVVASNRATMAASAAKFGLVSGLLAPLLHFRVGAALASRMIVGADVLTAKDAKDFGLVHHLVQSDQVWVRANGWVDDISAGAAEAIQLSKRVLNEMVGESLITCLASGAAALATSLTTEAAQEGLGAFAERREPKFPS